MKDYVKVFAPATVANVTCGFDILGFAVNEPGDELELEKIKGNQIILEEITGDDSEERYQSLKKVRQQCRY